MEITAKMVKELRDMTGVGPLDCKKALQANDGDIAKAVDFLREKGLATAGKKAGRAANEGLIEIYQHHNGRLGVIVEVNCETDFVANTDGFKSFAREVSLQIANLAPRYVTRDQVPQVEIDAEREVQRRRALEEGKPEHIVDKMIDGRMDKFFEEIVLMEQAYIKDDKKSIEDLRKEVVASLKENIVVRRFVRFEIGEEGDEVVEDDE